MLQDDERKLLRKAGMVFSDETLAAQALTHASHSDQAEKNGQPHPYQRLEFLGDRVLGLCIADWIYNAFPDICEGEMALRLNALVRKESCGRVMQRLGLDEIIRLDRAEARSGGHSKISIQGDICEALLGAYFLDQGLSAAQQFVKRHWQEMFAAQDEMELRDPKSELQEWIQAQGGHLPQYILVEKTGPDHAPSFTVEVQGDFIKPATGTAGSKQDAQRLAARAALEQIKQRENRAG